MIQIINRSLLFISLIILFGCKPAPKVSNEVESKLKLELQKEIEFYIDRNKLDCHCIVMIDYYNTFNGYQIFNIFHTRINRTIYSDVVVKTYIGCVPVYFFTGLEKNFNVQYDRDFLPQEVEPCYNDDIMIIDSFGYYRTIYDVMIFPDCAVPVYK